MAPPPEYDKEPKAPDKSVTNISTDDSKIHYNHVKEQPANTEPKSATVIVGSNTEVENNKHVETLDDGQLRALLDEAITYKCPKDREGKSSLFKELLEEVEQDEQACEAAARGPGPGRGARRDRARREHHSSLQDLVAAMAGEPAPRRGRAPAHAHAPPAASVSARAHHGGSLPSGVDTSFLLGEEACGRGSYLATVHVVNPPPLSERRVSASDAHPPVTDTDLVARRSKPMFPMTYTARATLEIGSGSVGSGRAVTTTTASNQVRTHHHPAGAHPAPGHGLPRGPGLPPPVLANRVLADRTAPRPPPSPPDVLANQSRLLNAMRVKGGGDVSVPRGPENDIWIKSVNNWYDTLDSYGIASSSDRSDKHNCSNTSIDTNIYTQPTMTYLDSDDSIMFNSNIVEANAMNSTDGLFTSNDRYNTNMPYENVTCDNRHNRECMVSEEDILLRKEYRQRVGNDLISPSVLLINPSNFRDLTIGNPEVDKDISVENNKKDSISEKYKIKYNKKCQKSPDILEVLEAKRRTNNKLNTVTSEVKSSHASKSDVCKSKVELKSEPSKDIKKCKTVRTNKLNLTNIQKDIQTSITYEETNTNKLLYNDCHTDNKNENISNKTIEILPKIKVSEVIKTNLKSEIFKQKCCLHKIYVDEELDIEMTAIESKTNVPELKPLSPIKEKFDKDKQKNEAFGIEMTEFSIADVTEHNRDINKHTSNSKGNDTISFSEFVNTQQNLFKRIEINTSCHEKHPSNKTPKLGINTKISEEVVDVSALSKESELPPEQFMLTKLPNNSYVFLTIPKTVSCKNTDSNKIKEITTNEKSKKKTTSRLPKIESLQKRAVKLLLYSDTDKTKEKVDSAIPFGCITSPEVVGCGTVTSTTQAAAVDPKPRSVISSSFNGLPLSRPALGAADDYKKSLDENGNAVQAFNSPLSGSSQHKKPRRKKSSKNETVIKSHQIDGYQGNKDLNELLRFIESNDDGGRPKLRPKHKDDCDDKAAKKRSTERRKDKDSKPKRASSLEELSRTTLEDLTDKPALRAARRAAHPPAKPERRSWGDDARSLLYRAPASAAADADAAPNELTDFQTVTKKKKPRRRADEPEHAPRRARAPSPEHRARAPPPSLPASDRSNDSNDDMDSVHSLPAAPPPPPPPPPHASYADIARTRHNIPDLIESCNFYAEGEAEAEAGGAGPEAGAAPGDADQYPALEPRRARDKRPSPPAARAPRKEPDVVADRRPPVVLLDSAARSRDMDGITFGFDINEQLLGGPGRRARCDLLRDAPEHAAAAARPACALRYVPPDPPPDAPQLHRIIDYVGTAWDDVIRCGTGKVLYYTE